MPFYLLETPVAAFCPLEVQTRGHFLPFKLLKNKLLLHSDSAHLESTPGALCPDDKEHLEQPKMTFCAFLWNMLATGVNHLLQTCCSTLMSKTTSSSRQLIKTRDCPGGHVLFQITTPDSLLRTCGNKNMLQSEGGIFTGKLETQQD